MRVSTAFNRLLRLEGVNVVDVEFAPARVVVTVASKRRRLSCPHCSFDTAARYDTRSAPSSWRRMSPVEWWGFGERIGSTA